MKHLLALTTMLTTIVPVVMSPQTIAKPYSPSLTVRTPAVSQPPHTETTSDRSEQINTPDRPIQPMQQNAQGKADNNKRNRVYPAYCEFYVFNVEPGSWQFQQDIQRCLYGQ